MAVQVVNFLTSRASETRAGSRISAACHGHAEVAANGVSKLCARGLSVDYHLDARLCAGPEMTIKYNVCSQMQKRRLFLQPAFFDLRRRARYFAKLGSIFLQASTSPRTAATELSNIFFSSALRVISTTFSTPPAPITVGTPTYRSFSPYWPLM
jgi:hypothetical protein